MISMEMKDKKRFARRWRPFRTLLDDESPLVRKALLNQLEENAEEGLFSYGKCLKMKIRFWPGMLKI